MVTSIELAAKDAAIAPRNVWTRAGASPLVVSELDPEGK